jgi:membrane associated rhomboid family serine protease
MRNVTETVKQLIIINILFFIGTLLVSGPAYKYLALFFPENQDFKAWQPITYMFMHGGFMHILFNMFALYSFGSALELFWGSKKFLFFYISCGLGSALVHTGVNYYHFQEGLNTLLSNGFSKVEILQLLNEGKIDTRWQELLTVTEFQNFTSAYLGTAVGASGAIYGIIVAFAFMFPDAELGLMFIPIPIKAKYFVPGLVLIDLYLGVSGKSIFGGGGIAHFAHVGGALFGFLIMWYWKKNQFNSNRWN